MSLFGIYGSHTVESCPLNHLESAKGLVSFAETDPAPLLSKYQIREVIGQYHSGLEHTFLWIVDAESPHLLEDFALESGLAAFNTLKIVPLKRLLDDVVPKVKKLHGL